MDDDIETEHEYAVLMHYGTPRRSGRYPWGTTGWGSGDTDGSQRSMSFLDFYKDLRSQGLTDPQIAEGMGFKSTTELRAQKSIAVNARRQSLISQAQRLHNTGMSNSAISREMGVPEPTIRNYLKPGASEKASRHLNTANFLREQVDKKKYIDVGVGVERHLGVSSTHLKTAIAILKEEGYKVHHLDVEQLGTGHTTSGLILAPKDSTYSEFYKERDQVQQAMGYTKDNGKDYTPIQYPKSVDSKRIQVVYKSEGGADADGVVYVRPGVSDLSMGGNTYAQVRIAVDGTHYIKGMAIYKDDLPPGVDLQFNTNKENTGKKLDALKPLDMDNKDRPFGAMIDRQITNDKNQLTSVMNLVNEQGDWDDWSRNLASQMLSKQRPSLIKEQLDKAYESKVKEFEEIQALTNPAVKRRLLESFADSADSSSVHLKAAAIKNQATKVILPINSLKDNEIYAPSFNDGDRVALVRYPHGGIFEIPELTVNNKHQPARKLLGNAPDAVGINSTVAGRLSGADFDGDTVLVIPNNNRKIKTSPPLQGLIGFEPQVEYPGYPGMKKMTAREKGIEMGQVSNLITDMTIKGAPDVDIARAVRHSMVVIDAEKHGLNYKESERVNNIRQLKEKYQGGPTAGASTLISQATAEIRVGDRRLRRASDGGPINLKTGEKVYTYTGETYPSAKTGKPTPVTRKSQRLAETNDAFSLIKGTGTVQERLYAEYSNNMKDLGNKARLAYVNTKPRPYSAAAKRAWASEVAELDAALNTALKNAPIERQAQIIAGAKYRAKLQANPDMSNDERKKERSIALANARFNTGAGKTRITITQSQWEAIQAGAVSNHKLESILRNADLEAVKKLATPKSQVLMTASKKSRAMAMLKAGATQSEVASALGVSLTTLKEGIKD